MSTQYDGQRRQQGGDPWSVTATGTAPAATATATTTTTATGDGGGSSALFELLAYLADIADELSPLLNAVSDLGTLLIGLAAVGWSV